MKMLDAALIYHAMGFSVIPIAENDKKPPKIEFLQYQTQQPTKEEIIGWWNRWPNANIGIVTGKLSRVCVVDHDRYKPDYNEEEALSLFPDDLITPFVETPRGGIHQWFLPPKEGISGRQGIPPGIDLRADGNYIIVPPSKTKYGTYRWMMFPRLNGLPPLPPADLRILAGPDNDLPEVTDLQELPVVYINKLNNTIYSSVRKVTKTMLHDVTNVTSSYIWNEGTRDDNLFHIAYCLAKTKNPPEYIQQTLRAIILSWGESDEKWITAKVESAMERSDRVDRNIQTEVDAFIAVTSGYFSVTSCYSELQAVTKEQKSAIRTALKRRCDKTIEKVGQRDGVYRRIDTDIVYMDFNEAEEVECPLVLPMGLHNEVIVCQGNIILVAGEFNSGKTTFSLSCVVLNKGKMPIRYLSSEMKVPEIKKRYRLFGIEKEKWWPDKDCQYIELRNNITDAMIPEGLNIVDYLEFEESDYTRAAEYFKKIHDKLTTGVAIVCIQKKVNQRLPRSGDMALEKPRLAITLTKLATMDESVMGIAEILKAKNVRSKKMDGKKLRYEIVKNGSQFNCLTEWEYLR